MLARISQPRTPKQPKRSAMSRNSPATKVSNKKSTEVEVDEDQMVRNMVASLHKDFLREFQKSERNPVNLYEFVCDPTSFSNTVENIFHVSFLVKDRKVGLALATLSVGSSRFNLSLESQIIKY